MAVVMFLALMGAADMESANSVAAVENWAPSALLVAGAVALVTFVWLVWNE